MIRAFALVAGLVYFAVGVLGFAATGFTGFVEDTDEALLGFDVNVFHNLVHLALGAALIVASQVRDVTITQGVVIGIGLFAVVAALLGFLDYLQILSVDGHLVADNFLHLISGVAALIVGLIAVRQQEDAVQREEVLTTGDLAAEGPLAFEERRALWDSGETYRERGY